MANEKNKYLAGIISPSAPIAAYCPRRLSRGIKFLEKNGFNVLLGKNVSALNKFTAGTAQERADDLNMMLANKDIKVIILTIGGYNANDILDLIDYDLARENNDKILIGYSDSTVILHALYKKSGLRTVMGPMILPQFAEYPEMQKFSFDSFLEIIENIGSGKKYKLPVSREYTEEMLSWDEEDNRPRVMEENKGWIVINGGKSEGVLMPANLNTLNKIIGTPYMPNLDGAILFLEDDSDESASTIQRMLQQLKQAGFLSKIKGLVFGRFQKNSSIANEDLVFILNNIFEHIDFPVLSNVDFGHTDPILSLPVGVQVKLDTDLLEIEIIL